MRLAGVALAGLGTASRCGTCQLHWWRRPLRNVVTSVVLPNAVPVRVVQTCLGYLNNILSACSLREPELVLGS